MRYHIKNIHTMKTFRLRSAPARCSFSNRSSSSLLKNCNCASELSNHVFTRRALAGSRSQKQGQKSLAFLFASNLWGWQSKRLFSKQPWSVQELPACQVAARMPLRILPYPERGRGFQESEPSPSCRFLSRISPTSQLRMSTYCIWVGSSKSLSWASW